MLLTQGTQGFSLLRRVALTCNSRGRRQMKGSVLTKSAFARATRQGSGRYTIQRSGTNILPLGINARRRNVGEPRWVAADRGIVGQLGGRMRMYHFASTRFSDAIGRLPSFEPSLLRKETVLILPSLCSTKAMRRVSMRCPCLAWRGRVGDSLTF